MLFLCVSRKTITLIKRNNMTIDLSQVSHHAALEEIVDIICNKTQNTDRGFFRATVAYFIGKVASSMRATVLTKDRGSIPVNIYTLCLSPSGTGKGYSVNILENEILSGFRKRFVDETMPTIADANLWKMANERAVNNATDPEEEKDKIDREYKAAGAYRFTFDSGTVPAVKQLRHKLILACAGAINFQVDEIGSNMIANVELLNTYLELYDQGLVKEKLTKNTAENQRVEEVDGKTPANMLLFGTPSKLLDGAQTENLFYEFLETGYARRCIFGMGKESDKAYNSMSPEEAYAQLIDKTNMLNISKWKDYFHRLADPSNFGWEAAMPDDVAIELIRYKFQCEKIADSYPVHEEIKKAEISHRYFKVLKLAGAYAFIDISPTVTMDHLLSAMLLVEESGESFQQILDREKAYIKLARYITTVGTDVTHADLHEALPFYKSGIAARNEMLTLAIAWGYKQHMIIKKSFVDGIEFYSGESLKETNLDEIIISYSDHFAHNYVNDIAPFDQLDQLIKLKDHHFLNHQLKNGHRTAENTIPGFNMVVLDVDGGTSIDLVKELLEDYTYLIYTTKSHTEADHRFRVLLPINYRLELDSEDYREFIDNLLSWLPFACDDVTNQPSRKWRTNDQSTIHRNSGQLIDVLQFIPRTSRNEEYKQTYSKLESLSNLDRWFAQRIAVGNRNKHMLRYALALVDSGMTFTEVQNQVKRFNASLNNALAETELERTILQTVAKRYTP